MIDLVSPFSPDASTGHLIELDESGQVVNRIRPEQNGFWKTKFLSRKAAAKEPWVFDAKPLYSLKLSGQILTSAQGKKRRFKSHHPIPQADFIDEEIFDVWPAGLTISN